MAEERARVQAEAQGMFNLTMQYDQLYPGSMLDVCFGGDRRKRKTDSTFKSKRNGPSQREAEISHVLELFDFEKTEITTILRDA